jgi:hypothetical protein
MGFRMSQADFSQTARNKFIEHVEANGGSQRQHGLGAAGFESVFG